VNHGARVVPQFFQAFLLSFVVVVAGSAALSVSSHFFSLLLRFFSVVAVVVVLEYVSDCLSVCTTLGLYV